MILRSISERITENEGLVPEQALMVNRPRLTKVLTEKQKQRETNRKCQISIIQS